MKHPVIIGAGGVASYLLPVLIKSFKPESILIVDADVLEERNIDRQLFSPDMIGCNKAEALLETNSEIIEGIDVKSIDAWFSESMVLPEETDAIICCADNHEARHNVMKFAVERGIRAYIGGNEYLDSQAFVYDADIAESERSPLKRYPNIATSKEGSPFRCTGEAQAASPQLAVANLNCAAKLLHLMWVYEKWLVAAKMENPVNKVRLEDHLPVELFTSLNENSSR